MGSYEWHLYDINGILTIVKSNEIHSYNCGDGKFYNNKSYVVREKILGARGNTVTIAIATEYQGISNNHQFLPAITAPKP